MRLISEMTFICSILSILNPVFVIFIVSTPFRLIWGLPLGVTKVYHTDLDNIFTDTGASIYLVRYDFTLAGTLRIELELEYAAHYAYPFCTYLGSIPCSEQDTLLDDRSKHGLCCTL